jgi:predicted esterase
LYPDYLTHEEESMNRKLILGVVVVVLLFVGLLAGPAMADGGFSEDDVVGHSKGNHRLDCYVARPWNVGEPSGGPYPVIVWANGWGGNNVAGAIQTDWYKPMLNQWVADGPFIVIAANAWSAREDDVLKCLQWIVDQNTEVGGEYEGMVDTSKIGLAGHSQGAGAVVKAGDGEPNGFEITTVLAMNPYGPSWVSAGDQDGPVMVLTGFNDVVTPYSWTYPVFEAQQKNGNDALYAVHAEAGHSDLDLYQDVIALWWQFQLNGNTTAVDDMKDILNADPWETQYTGSLGD